jgi:hypothetical protein
MLQAQGPIAEAAERLSVPGRKGLAATSHPRGEDVSERLPPIYPDEDEIAVLVLGPKRAKDWPAIAVIDERKGLPKIDPLYGGRYWPAVARFYTIKNGLDCATTSSPTMGGRPRIHIAPLAPDGEENFDAEKEATVRHRRRDRRPIGTRA